MSTNSTVVVKFPFGITTVFASDGSTITADSYGNATINANLMASLLSAGFTEVLPLDGQLDGRFVSQTAVVDF